VNSKSLSKVISAPPSIQLRLARPADADYIFSLRTDPSLNQHLSPAPLSSESQQRYLESYLVREENGQEYYFIIENKALARPCGTIRIYDIREDSFCWGSWILDSTKPRLAALESALFIYDFGMGLLRFPASHFDVRRDNVKVIAFHMRFGARVTSEDELNIYFRLDSEDLLRVLPQLLRLTAYRPVFLRAKSVGRT
jgi:hypothetical protein